MKKKLTFLSLMLGVVVSVQAQNATTITAPLFLPFTYYENVAHEALSLDEKTSDVNATLLNFYLKRPDLVATSESQLREQYDTPEITEPEQVVVTTPTPEITAPEELQRHFCGTAGITYVAGLHIPIAALIEIETCLGINLICPKHLSHLRKHICFLGGVKVRNTTAALIELVVPGNRTASDKALGDKIEILLEGEIGEHACDGAHLIT